MYFKETAMRSFCIGVILLFTANVIHARSFRRMVDTTSAGAIAGTVTLFELVFSGTEVWLEAELAFDFAGDARA